MKRINKWLLFLSLITINQFGFTQTQPIEEEVKAEETSDEDEDISDKNWKDRIVVGGNLAAQFGSATFIQVSPLVGYRVTKNLTSGVGFSYQYISENYNALNFYDYKAQVFGARVFSQYDLFYGLFAHAEYEMSWYKIAYEDANLEPYQGNVPALFLGGGYNFMVGENARFQLMALYDVLHNIESINYNALVIRMGFSIGL